MSAAPLKYLDISRPQVVKLHYWLRSYLYKDADLVKIKVGMFEIIYRRDYAHRLALIYERISVVVRQLLR